MNMPCTRAATFRNTRQDCQCHIEMYTWKQRAQHSKSLHLLFDKVKSLREVSVPEKRAVQIRLRNLIQMLEEGRNSFMWNCLFSRSLQCFRSRMTFPYSNRLVQTIVDTLASLCHPKLYMYAYYIYVSTYLYMYTERTFSSPSIYMLFQKSIDAWYPFHNVFWKY